MEYSPLLSNQNDSEKDEYKDIIHEAQIFDLTKKTTRHKQKYSYKKKLEIIDYAKAYVRNNAAKKYDLAISTITYWMKEKDNLLNQTN